MLKNEIYRVTVKIKVPPFPLLHEDLPNNGEFQVLVSAKNEKEAKKKVLTAFPQSSLIRFFPEEESLVRIIKVESFLSFKNEKKIITKHPYFLKGGKDVRKT